MDVRYGSQLLGESFEGVTEQRDFMARAGTARWMMSDKRL